MNKTETWYQAIYKEWEEGRPCLSGELYQDKFDFEQQNPEAILIKIITVDVPVKGSTKGKSK